MPTLNSPATPWAARVNNLEELGKWDWEVTHAARSHNQGWAQHSQETLFDVCRQSASGELEWGSSRCLRTQKPPLLLSPILSLPTDEGNPDPPRTEIRLGTPASHHGALGFSSGKELKLNLCQRPFRLTEGEVRLPAAPGPDVVPFPPQWCFHCSQGPRFPITQHTHFLFPGPEETEISGGPQIQPPPSNF